MFKGLAATLLCIKAYIAYLLAAGSGKSSLVAALLRLTERCDGCIMLDGRDIRTIPLRQLRSTAGVVPQTPFLFDVSCVCMHRSVLVGVYACCKTLVDKKAIFIVPKHSLSLA